MLRFAWLLFVGLLLWVFYVVLCLLIVCGLVEFCLDFVLMLAIVVYMFLWWGLFCSCLSLVVVVIAYLVRFVWLGCMITC